MSRADLPQNVYAFLLEHIDSLEQLEVLLLMRKDQRSWSAQEIARELRIMPESAGNRMSNLSLRGIVIEDGSARYRYSPRSPELDRDVAGLATAYAERRVTVINLIATKHLERIKSFADAFKLKGGR